MITPRFTFQQLTTLHSSGAHGLTLDGETARHMEASKQCDDRTGISEASKFLMELIRDIREENTEAMTTATEWRHDRAFSKRSEMGSHINDLDSYYERLDGLQEELREEALSWRRLFQIQAR